MEDIVIIGNPNKAPVSAKELLSAGFTWKISPEHRAATGINLTGAFDAVGCGSRRSCNDRENNIRSAWAAILRDFADYPEETVFGESDITPSAGVTRDYVREFVQHPHMKLYDVVCLSNNTFHECSVTPPEPGGKSIYDLRLAVKHITAGTFGSVFKPVSQWGVQAVWIRPKARKVLEYLFMDINAPTDVTLIHAAVKGILRVGKLYSNMFFQAPVIKNTIIY